jgi:hypothetical protein
MPTIYLHQITSKIDRVFQISENIEDDEVKANLSKYLCVLTSGFIEESIKIIIRDYVVNRTTNQINNHINSIAKKQTNFDVEKIGTYLNSFDPKWKNDLDKNLSNEEKDAINSILANRNQIAHGKDVGVSYITIKKWYDNAKSSIEKIRTIVNS